MKVEQMKLTHMAAIVLLGLVVLAGCATKGEIARREVRTASREAPERTTRDDPAIVLPAGSNRSLPQAPGDGTERGAVVAAAIVAAGDGIVISGTVESIRTEKGEFDLTYPVVTMRAERTFAGDPADAVTISTADPMFAMDVGGTYLAFLTRGSPDAAYTPVDTYVFDSVDGGWEARQPSTVDGRKPAQPLILSNEDVSRIVIDGKAYLDERTAASRAVMRAEHGEEPGVVVVSGYAEGASIELRVCAIGDDFDPKTDAALRCGAHLVESLVPDPSSFAVRYSPPKELELGDGTTVSCAEARCALVAYDAGWPDKVFTIFDGT